MIQANYEQGGHKENKVLEEATYTTDDVNASSPSRETGADPALIQLAVLYPTTSVVQ